MSYYKHNHKYVPFSTLSGLILKDIIQDGDEKITFITDSGREFQMYHKQDCCEHVYVESVVGDLTDLLGSPILLAEVASQDDPSAESGTWTFYKLATVKGYVDIRWYGSSNGYYGEDVDFYEIGGYAE